MIEAPDAFLPAWESLLTDDDPWVAALARMQLGKMRIMLGDGGRHADADLETALDRFRALGERFGISFAQTELAERIASRGDLAGACAHYEQAIAAVTEIGALDDVIRMRARQSLLYRQVGDADSGAAAMAEAERYAAQVAWPGTLAILALSKAELARRDGDAAEVHRQLAVVRTMLGAEVDESYLRAGTHDLLGYLAEDLDEARAHRAAACAAAAEAGHSHVTAQVLVGVADLALRRDQYEQAARLLAASAAVRGLQDRSHPDLARIERAARNRLGDTGFAEAAREGAETSWTELVAVTLAS
jgi:hypothetical protein